MDDAASRRLALGTMCVFAAVLLLRAWANLAYPLLDVTDRAPLRAALAGAGVLGSIGWYVTGGRARGERFVLVLMTAVAGIALGDACFLTGNAFFDRSETRWVPYTIAQLLPGRHGTTVALTHEGRDAPQTIWVLEHQVAGKPAVGNPSIVPVRTGAFGSAWREGKVLETRK